MNETQPDRPSLDDYDEEALHPERYPNPILRRVGKGIKWFFCALAALVFVLMIWRIQVMEHLPAQMKTLTVTESTYAAYRDAQARGETLELLTQGKIDPVSTNDQAYGYFWIADSVLIPQAEQLQLVIQYNNSTLEHLADDFGLEQIPSGDDEVLAIRLCVITDATPDDLSDQDEADAQLTQIILPSAEPTGTQRDVYHYRRYVFDAVPVDQTLIGLRVEFYYAGDEQADEPLAELYVWYQGAESKSVKLSKKDIAALEDFGEK